MATWPFRTLSEKIRESVNDVGVVSGTATITDASQTESTAFAIITMAGPSLYDLSEVDVMIDLAKASTGFAAVESSATIQLCVARAVDGTNYRREAYVEAALSGTNAANRMQRVPVGRILAGETVKIYAVMSADATADIVLPYQVYYRGMQAPTVS